MKSLFKLLLVTIGISALHGCIEDPLPPELTTKEVSDITISSAISGGQITSDGGAPIIAQGVCYSTTVNPSVADNKTTESIELTSFSSTLTDLSPKTQYYVMAYATNDAGTGYGTILSFTTGGDQPGATATNATNIQLNSSTINGLVNPFSLPTTVTFEWGTTSSYGSTATASQSPMTGAIQLSVSADLTGLTPGTTYHFRIKAENSLGITYSDGLTFKTLGGAPVAEALSSTNIQYNEATIKGRVNANYLPTSVTFEWGETTTYGNSVSLSQNPVTGQDFVDLSNELSGLTQGLTYHFRLRAENELGTTYSNDLTFTTLAPITDYEGNTYNIRSFGDQVWMTENLKSSVYPDGTSIAFGLYNPGNNISNVEKRGYLYSWSAAIKQPEKYDTIMLDVSGQRVQGVCPTNWHLPTEAEWMVLIDLYGGKTVAGLKLKIANPGYWSEPLVIEEPLSGFNAIPAGMRHADGWYNSELDHAMYWTTTQHFMGGAIMGRNIDIRSFYPNVTTNYTNTNNVPGSFGLSVRCMRDY